MESIIRLLSTRNDELGQKFANIRSPIGSPVFRVQGPLILDVSYHTVYCLITWETSGDRSSCFPGGGRPIWRSPSCRRRHRPRLRWFRALLCPWSRRRRGSGGVKQTRDPISSFVCPNNVQNKLVGDINTQEVTQWRNEPTKWPRNR